MIQLSSADLLSIVVTTYEEKRKKDLDELLKSVKGQTYANLEVIVVVEKSEALFSAIRNQLEALGLRHKVIFSEGLKGISYARNLGIENADGIIVAIVDDDLVLSANWAEILMKTYHDYPHAMGVTGQAIPLWIDSSNSWFPPPLYWMIGCTGWRGWHTRRETNIAAGANMSFRKEAFMIAKFPTSLGAGASTEGKLGFPNEDNDFAMQITAKTGRPIIYDPHLTAMHKVYPYRLRPKYILKYAFWQGCAEARYMRMPYSRGQRGSPSLKLLKELLLRDIPSILIGLSTRKSVALKKLRLIVFTLSFFAFGYVAYVLRLHNIRIRSRTRLTHAT